MRLKPLEISTKFGAREVSMNARCSVHSLTLHRAEDEPHGSRPSTIDNDQLKVLVEADPCTTVRALAEELNVHPSTVARHLKQIGKAKKLDKWVPHELNENQKNRRFEVSSSLLQRYKNDPFLDRIVTCDENGSSTTIGDVRHSDWTPAKLQNTSRSLFGGLQPVSSTTAS